MPIKKLFGILNGVPVIFSLVFSTHRCFAGAIGRGGNRVEQRFRMKKVIA